MSDIQKSTIQEIVTLHQEIAGHLKMSLEKAIRAGIIDRGKVKIREIGHIR